MTTVKCFDITYLGRSPIIKYINLPKAAVSGEGMEPDTILEAEILPNKEWAEESSETVSLYSDTCLNQPI